MMNKKVGILISILAVIALCLSAVNLGLTLTHKEPVQVETQADTQYVMYLGTNDAETNEPVFSAEECKDKAKEILVRHFGGYTLSEAEGGWADDGKLYQEYTLVIYLSDTTLEKVHEAAKEMIDTFHQSCVLIQANQTSTEFYDGTK